MRSAYEEKVPDTAGSPTELVNLLNGNNWDSTVAYVEREIKSYQNISKC